MNKPETSVLRRIAMNEERTARAVERFDCRVVNTERSLRELRPLPAEVAELRAEVAELRKRVDGCKACTK